MSPSGIGAFVHGHAPHSGEALFLSSITFAIIALLLVYGRCLWTGSTEHLPENWIVTIAAAAAPVPTYLLLIVVPLDHDLSLTMLDDPVVVGLAGLYGLAAAFRDTRGMAAKAHITKRAQKPAS